MKLGEIKIDFDEVLNTLTNGREREYTSSDIYDLEVGDDEPAVNVFRIVGMVYSRRVHYLRGYTSGGKIPGVVACIGAGCPVCSMVRKLYNTGLVEAIDKAKQLRVTERYAVATIPRGVRKGNVLEKYPWQEDNKCYVLMFGAGVKKELLQITRELGYPGDIDNGFDLELYVKKRGAGAFGKTYNLQVHKKRVREKNSFVERINVTPLTDQERQYEVPDLNRYFQDPSEETLKTLCDLFEIQYKSNSVHHADLADAKVDSQSEDGDNKDCYGDVEQYDENSTKCMNCDMAEDCLGIIVANLKEEK